MSFKATEYSLVNVADGHRFQDTGWSLTDTESKIPSLVRAEYATKEFKPDDEAEGLYRYHNWMPIKHCLKGSCAPATYKSKGLAKELGLSNLYITFNGWYPEVGARMKTASFKETEAYSVCGRLPEEEKRILVVSSAGNTARAFASVCSKNHIPLLLTIPLDNMSALWFDTELDPCVKIVAAPSHSDYFDAITVADKACTSPRFLAEGGAKNIARRDGMGTTLLSAVEAIGEIPDAYFQAIGSGTGAIAAWENNLRLIGDGRYSDKKMRLLTSQNAPFTIMHDSWRLRSRNLVDFSAERAREASSIIKAKVLSNRKPPYSLAGGMFDALMDSCGDIYMVDNGLLDYWKERFIETEGVDIYSAASVAVASLALAVKNGDVDTDEIIMLNITGGGEKKVKQELGSSIYYPKPDMIISPDTPAEEVVAKVESLF